RSALTQLSRLSLHDALPISFQHGGGEHRKTGPITPIRGTFGIYPVRPVFRQGLGHSFQGPADGFGGQFRISISNHDRRSNHSPVDRKSTRLNSSHVKISYAV